MRSDWMGIGQNTVTKIRVKGNDCCSVILQWPQASWDAERRELLRRELLATQISEAMVPHLRPGCPLRDLAAVRGAASWCDELARWRLPDTSSRIPLPPPPPLDTRSKPDHNNNSDDKSSDDDISHNERKDIVGTYFKRNRIDELLARAREAKTFEANGRLSKSGGSDDSNNYLQLNALNLQSSAPAVEAPGKIPSHVMGRPIGSFNSWLVQDTASRSITSSQSKKIPPRILEALPSRMTS
uniref:Kif17 protein n=1 Tax=Fopius arisanus TaxID=64838 RepID=A0A0C9RJ43_9HYME